MSVLHNPYNTHNVFCNYIHLLCTCVSVHTQKVQRKHVHAKIWFDNTHTHTPFWYCWRTASWQSFPQCSQSRRRTWCPGWRSAQNTSTRHSLGEPVPTHTNTYCVLYCIHMQKQDDQVTMVTTHPASLDDDAHREQFSHCALWGGVCVCVCVCQSGHVKLASPPHMNSLELKKGSKQTYKDTHVSGVWWKGYERQC